jgi:hypothetical protein
VIIFELFFIIKGGEGDMYCSRKRYLGTTNVLILL